MDCDDKSNFQERSENEDDVVVFCCLLLLRRLALCRPPAAATAPVVPRRSICTAWPLLYHSHLRVIVAATLAPIPALLSGRRKSSKLTCRTGKEK